MNAKHTGTITVCCTSQHHSYTPVRSAMPPISSEWSFSAPQF